MAAVLSAGPGAAVSHRAAAVLHGIGDLSISPVPVEISHLRGRRPRLTNVSIHRPQQLDQVDIELVDGIPTTTVARTVVDLAGLLAPADLEYLLDDAICKRVTVARIRWRFEALTHRGRAGVATLGALLAERGRRYVPPQRQLEHRVLRLLKRSGVPAPVHQHPVYRDGTLLAKLDFAWPDQRVAIEADGFEVHGTSKRAFEHDRRRGNKVVLDRWLVLHVTWQRLDTDPDGFLAEVREALGLPTAA